MTAPHSLALRRAFVDDLTVPLPVPREAEHTACADAGRIILALQNGTALPEASPELCASIRTFFRYLRDCAQTSGDLDLAAWTHCFLSATGRHRNAARSWAINSEGEADPLGFLAAFTDAQLQAALEAK